eukprot:gene9958-10978_t
MPGIIGNGLIIAAVVKLRSLKTPTNYMISNLAVADLIVMFGMVLFLIMDAFMVGLPDNLHVYFFPSIDIFVASASIMSLAAVSFDRGLAVTKPLHYERLFYRKRALHIIIGIWSYASFIFTASMLRCKFTAVAYANIVLTIAYICGFVIPLVIVAIAYTVILITTVRVIKVSRQLELSVNRASSFTHPNNERRQRTNHVQLREAKVALNFMLILVPFLVGWGFYFGTFWSEHIQSTSINKSHLYEWFLLVIPWFISSVNPIVYILFTRLLRQGCKKLLRRLMASQDDGQQNSSSIPKMFSFARRKSSMDSQSKSLLSLFWARAKRTSSNTSETALMSRFGGHASRGEEMIAECSVESTRQ